MEVEVSTPQSGKTSAYTVVPNPDEPVILQIGAKLCRLVEISAAGFTCPVDSVKPGRRYQFSLGLPTVSKDIEGYADVLPLNDRTFLNCQFVDLDSEDIDQLHYYALVRQKEALRSIRAGKQNWR